MPRRATLTVAALVVLCACGSEEDLGYSDTEPDRPGVVAEVAARCGGMATRLWRAGGRLSDLTPAQCHAARVGQVQLLGLLAAELGFPARAATDALLCAAPERELEAVAWLIERGADVNGQDEDGRTVLARVAGSPGTAAPMLVAAGAVLGAAGTNGETRWSRLPVGMARRRPGCCSTWVPAPERAEAAVSRRCTPPRATASGASV